MFDNIEDHYDRICDTLDELNFSEITVIVGPNASGKSLVTSQATFRYKEEHGHALPHTSMRLRTESVPSMGALSSIAHDTSWLATSHNTIHSIKMVVNMVLEHGKKCLVIDEPEIGVGEELLLGLIDYLNETIKTFREKGIGCIIVTHRRDIVKLLDKDKFVSLDGMTEEEWLTRIVVKRPVEDFEKDASELHSYIRARSREIKDKDK